MLAVPVDCDVQWIDIWTCDDTTVHCLAEKIPGSPPFKVTLKFYQGAAKSKRQVRRRLLGRVVASMGARVARRDPDDPDDFAGRKYLIDCTEFWYISAAGNADLPISFFPRTEAEMVLIKMFLRE